MSQSPPKIIINNKSLFRIFSRMEPVERHCDTRRKDTAPIDALPVELMRVIFITYYEHTRAPILLLFVCRRWNQIALSISSLWEDIRFDSPRTIVLPMEQTMHIPVTCFTWSKLEFAATRAGRATIEISTPYMNENPNAHIWLSKYCKSLQISSRWAWSSRDIVKTFHSLASVESISLRRESIGDSDLRLLLQDLEEKKHPTYRFDVFWHSYGTVTSLSTVPQPPSQTGYK